MCNEYYQTFKLEGTKWNLNIPKSDKMLEPHPMDSSTNFLMEYSEFKWTTPKEKQQDSMAAKYE